MQSVSSRIWTRVAVSISYDDKPLHHGHLLKLFNAKSCLCMILSEQLKGIIFLNEPY